MKVIFLDIDGVMNSENRAVQLNNLHKNGLITEQEWFDWDMPYEDTLNALSYIVKNTDAKIVLSSTWRFSPERIDKLNQHFEPYGFKIYDKTCSGVSIKRLNQLGFKEEDCYNVSINQKGIKYTCDRGAEIAEWISTHDVESFVILDDDIADIKPYYIKEQIRTDFYKDALNMKLAKKAVGILNGN